MYPNFYHQFGRAFSEWINTNDGSVKFDDAYVL